MNKKSVLAAAATFVIGAVGGILLMMSNDAYKAVSDALGSSTSNALVSTQQQSQAAKQREEQIGQLLQQVEVMKQQANLIGQAQMPTTGGIGAGITKNDPKDQDKSKQDEAAQKALEAAQQQQQLQQQQLQQQMTEMIKQIQQFLQQVKESDTKAMQVPKKT